MKEQILKILDDNKDSNGYIPDFEFERVSHELIDLFTPSKAVEGKDVGLWEELWDKHSTYIEDNSDSFKQVAGYSVITKYDFKKAIEDFASIDAKVDAVEGKATSTT